MRDYKETVEWYEKHQTTNQIGFNPDGMCLKVCRTARDIGSMFLTAKQAQDATPKEHRVTRVRDLRKGMVLFFDTVGDSNPFGHIVTQIGRVRGADLDSLDDILVETNSVKSGELVVVRASYFGKHWGDKFQFGSDWLNGQELDYWKPKPPKHVDNTPSRVENFWESRPAWNIGILDRAVDAGRRDIKAKVDAMHEAVADLPTDLKQEEVNEFLESYNKKGLLRIHLLDQLVRADGRFVRVKSVRDRLNSLIKSLPRS